jgi:hypothetical protein
MSEHEQRDEQEATEEQIEDLDVSEEQTDDVTGGAFRRGRDRNRPER